MTVPGIGPIISSAMVAAIGIGEASPKAPTSAPGSGWSRNKSRPETGLSSAAYQSTAIAICALSSFRRLGWCWSSSGLSSGSAMGSNLGLKRRRSDYTTTCSPLRWPTSSPISRGRFSTRGAPSRATRPMRWRPVQRNPRAVLGPVKACLAAQTREAGLRDGEPGGPCARRVRGPQVGTKERPPGTNKGTAQTKMKSPSMK